MIGITGAKGVLGRIICRKLKSQYVDFSIFNGTQSNRIAKYSFDYINLKKKKYQVTI